MPRDGNGNFTLAPGNPVVPGTIIEAGWANPTLSDIAANITDSLSRTGQGGMLVPFRNADGTVGAPGMSWNNEPTSGWYRAALNDFWYSVGNENIFRITKTGIELAPGKTTTNITALAFVQDPDPAPVPNGSSWFESDTGDYYLRYQNPDATFTWVQTNAASLGMGTFINLTVTGDTTLGDNAADQLTINAGTWTYGNLINVTQDSGTLAAGSTLQESYIRTFTGDAGGTTSLIGWTNDVRNVGANAVAGLRGTRSIVRNTGAGVVANGWGFTSLVASAGTGGFSVFQNFNAEAPVITAGTIGTLYGYRASNQGHASAVTAVGFICNDFTGSTVMRSFQGDMTSGAGKANLYMGGNADNILAGNVRIGSTVAPTVPLDVTGNATVSGNAVITGNLNVSGNTVIGSGPTDTLLVSCEAVSQPAIPCFQAYLSTTVSNVTGAGVNYIPVYDTEPFDQSGDFDGVSTFTAPVTGKYQLNFSIRMAGLTAAMTQRTAQILTSNRSYSDLDLFVFSADANYSWQLSVVAEMEAGDTAFTRITCTNGAGNTADMIGAAGIPYTMFSGVKVA